MIRPLALAAVLALVLGCGSGSGQQDKTTAQNASPSAAADPNDGKGIGPIKEVTLGPIDPELAEQGQKLFDTKCAVCHKFEERYVGPALAGVTGRHKPEWIMNMMLNPEQMIQEDPQAKALFAQFLTPMANQNVTQEEAKAILTYIRSVEATAAE